MALWAHQREIVAVASHQSVLVSCTHAVGKTYMSAALLRDHAVGSFRSEAQGRSLAIAVASSMRERRFLQLELARSCAMMIWCIDDHASLDKSSDVDTSQWMNDGVKLAVLSPTVLQNLLRNRILAISDIGFLVVEGSDQVQSSAPSFFDSLFDVIEASSMRLRIFATTNLPGSKLDYTSRFASYIRILTIVPALSGPSLPVPQIAPLMCETFEEASPHCDAVSVRDFLLGGNSKKIDLVRVFRTELEMGNSAAIYDERKKQDKVNQFIRDAEIVENHLGRWCLLKFVEMELQTHLQACIVDDSDNVDALRQRRSRQDSEHNDIPIDNELSDDTTADYTLESVLAKKPTDVDESLQERLKPIIKVIRWLNKLANQVGVTKASPRLLQTARIIHSRFANTPTKEYRKKLRCWIFVERRCHSRVVAEYITAFLEPLDIPPCCCMLGNSNARVAKSLHFSSYVRIMTMFTKSETNLVVTTSIASTSQKQRTTPPLCDLVVIMDELTEPEKLLAFTKRANSLSGVVKYVLPNTKADIKKFDALKLKMDDLALVDSAPSTSQQQSRSVDISSNFDNPMTGSTVSLTDESERNIVANPIDQKIAAPNANNNEIVHSETGAVLNLTNSIKCLSNFCDSLPGLDTYDLRPQYDVKRHPIMSGMSAATKQWKKKKLKYNARLDDKIDDCKADSLLKQQSDRVDEVEGEQLENNAEEADARFQYTAHLKLPDCLKIKKRFTSPKVGSVLEAKSIVSFKACKELLKSGLLDRHFRSVLFEDDSKSIHRDENDNEAKSNSNVANAKASKAKPDQDIAMMCEETMNKLPQQLDDMSTQNSYDLPPVSAAELSLRPVRSLAQDETGSITMYLYGLSGMNLAILASDALYTGNTNTGWRYDFATSDVMSPVLRPITLQKLPTPITLTRDQLHQALHFHLIMMRLACMGVSDALREVSVANDEVWQEFSEQNDKGYLVVPSMTGSSTECFALDWNILRDTIESPILEPMWPLPTELPSDDWICVPMYRQNVKYIIRNVENANPTFKELSEECISNDKAWKKQKSKPGKPILGRWHTPDQLRDADADQPLLYGIQVPEIVPLIRRVMQRNNDETSIAQAKFKFNERWLVPQYTTRLRMNKTRFFEAMGMIPLLYEFERKCQMSNLMAKIGMDVDMTLLDDATTKPAYERLEILGDTFLKLETSWYMYEDRKDIVQEGQLTQLRRDIIRNDRLNQFALAVGLHHYILYPAEVEQHPFQCWKPSCMGKTPDPVVASSKWIADVLEAICGAYLVGQGEIGARYFLRWIGVSVLDDPFTFASPFYPDCFPKELYEHGGLNESGLLTLSSPQFEDLPLRLATLQHRLKYTFRNPRYLLEAITHPSVGRLMLHEDHMSGSSLTAHRQQDIVWKGDYERLEYLGDAIIEYLTLSYAYLAHGDWLPGSLSQWKSATVSNDALGKTVLRWFGIDECMCSGALRMDKEAMKGIDNIERRYLGATGSSSFSKRMGLQSSRSYSLTTVRIKTKKTTTKANPLSLPKVFADVFEALVAAVFLDSDRDLHQVRDVFLGPLLETVGEDALAYVCRESGLSMQPSETIDNDDLILFSSDDEDDTFMMP